MNDRMEATVDDALPGPHFQPVMQEYLHGQGNENGDCLRAAVASLLCLDIQEVPHFCSKENGSDDGAWWKAFQQWLHSRGYTAINLRYGQWVKTWLAHSYHLLAGPSPRFPEEMHQVVAKGGEIVHDPHPDQSGLLPPNEHNEWEVTVLVPLIPGRTRRFVEYLSGTEVRYE